MIAKVARLAIVIVVGALFLTLVGVAIALAAIHT